MARGTYKGGYKLSLAENSGPLYNDYVDDAKYYEELREVALSGRDVNKSVYITSRQRSLAHTENVINKQRNIQMTTKVITIAEMYQIIPETMKIKNQEADLKDTLSNVIKYIEQSGEWEFVQYIPKSATNLALIIVRENYLMSKSDQPKSAWTPTPAPQTIPIEERATFGPGSQSNPEADTIEATPTGRVVDGKPAHMKMPWE